MADSAGGLTNSAYAQPIPGSGGGPWGSGVTTNLQTFNPRRWATPGQADTISTFRTRQYDPGTGVWLQEDPIGIAGGVNLYQYNGNDPNSFGDPFGTCPKDAGGDDKTDLYSDCPVGSSGYHAYLAAHGKGGIINDVLGAIASCRESTHCKFAALAGGAVTATAAGVALLSEGLATTEAIGGESAGALGRLTGFVQHGINQIINRGVGPGAIMDALRNGSVRRVVDNLGRISYQWIGKQAVVVLNEAGKIITVWRLTQ
jgi:RHS repeat-associated protein